MIKKIGFRSVIIICFAVLSGGLLFYTSQSVQRKEEELRTKRIELAREELAMRVLKAEWAYLNSPPRLEALASEYLGLRAPGTEQFMPKASLLPKIVPAQIFQEVSISPGDGAASPKPVSEVFVRPPQKPVRKPVRQSPVTKKRFDTLLNELGSGGAQ